MSSEDLGTDVFAVNEPLIPPPDNRLRAPK
jgi:hypothetical protein